MKILLGDFNAKVGREGGRTFLNQYLVMESLHEANNDNGVRVSKFCNFEKSNC
jgi:hypothetical protein